MAAPKFQSPFPPLKLSLDEKRELCRKAKRLVGDVVEDYERYLWIDQEKLSPSRWAVVKEREDVRVYHDRRPGAGTDDKDLNVLLTIGTVVGSLHDVMYGVLNHTTEAMRLKTAYVQDTVSNCAVLATIQEPKDDKPFRSVTVKWLVKSVPLPVRAVAKHRDCVYVEATGIKKLSTGDQIGFHLLHSVKYPQTPALSQYSRLSMSICTIWRQQNSERVQAYCKSYLEVTERLVAPLIIKSSADALVSMWRYMHCAQMKKLAWLMRRKTPILEDAKGQGRCRDGGCGACGSQSSSSRQGVKSMCVICARSICSACRVKRDLFAVSPNGPLLERRVAFCVPCLTIAVRADGYDVARDEIPGVEVPQGALSELIKVVGTRASCPVSDDRERVPSGSSRRLSLSSSSSGSDRPKDRAPVFKASTAPPMGSRSRRP